MATPLRKLPVDFAETMRKRMNKGTEKQQFFSNISQKQRKCKEVE